MLYYLYEIKNNINGKLYLGVHKTSNIDDGYMGSGKRIKTAITKYGVENFTKTILEYFVSTSDMYAREAEVITEDFVNRDDVYNLRVGGKGGWDYLDKTGANKIGRKNADIVMEQKYGPNWRSHLGKLASSGITDKSLEKRRITRIVRGIKSDSSSMNTQDVNERRKETFKRIGHSKGAANSQFGSMWITDGTENKKIKKDSVIPNNWNKGRTLLKRKEEA